MKKKKYRVAIVGCGNIGALYEAEPKREKPASHAGAVRQNNRTELVAFVDTNVQNLSVALKLFPHNRCYESLTECLKTERPDIVVIATPATARLALINECLRFGVRMIVCEKPLATNVREAKQIQTLVAKSGATFVLNYQRRFSPLFARLHADIKKGKLGRIQQITCYYSNGLYNNAGHIIDLLTYVLGESIVSAIGVRDESNNTHPKDDINADALLQTQKGTFIVLQSFDQKEYGIFDIRLYGTKGSAILTDYGMTFIETSVGPSRFKGIRQLDRAREHMVTAPFSATKDALSHVIEAYEKRREAVSSVKSGLVTLRVLTAVAKSAARGGSRVLIK